MNRALDRSDINKDGKLDVQDLGSIFKTRRKDRQLREGFFDPPTSSYIFCYLIERWTYIYNIIKIP